ncbi:MAG: ferritin-like domain-containing protein [Nostoc sp.]|uniref:ferritin-like domain-containing protein n=1 Tax=Nostoc sp. TaxID=1180 RepID=UPI002FFA3673
MSLCDEDRQKLKDLLQQAAQVELSTIPIYLYAMYSIKPGSPSSDSLYKDKAYNLLRSVAIKKMLHLSLVCNLIQSIGGTVNLFDTYKNLNPEPIQFS